MAKSHFFRNFFKLIFSLVAVALAVISVGFLFGPFVTSASDEVLTFTAAFSISGFNLAFNGEGLAAIYQNGEIIEDLSSTLTLENPSIGTQIGIYLLFAGLLLAIIYLIFCWGHKAVKIKKFIGGISAFVLVIAAILFFVTVPMSGIDELTVSSYKLTTNELGYGAIISGAASGLSAIAMVIATFLGPKE